MFEILKHGKQMTNKNAYNWSVLDIISLFGSHILFLFCYNIIFYLMLTMLTLIFFI